MQAAHPPRNHAIPPSGTQMQEMFELSSWLDDVFTIDPPSFPAASDLKISPDMFLSAIVDGMDHEVDNITSSPASPLDCLDVVEPVSPISFPCSPTSTAILPEIDAFRLQTKAPASVPSTKRKQPKGSVNLVSDSSDNDEETAQINPPKRQRRVHHTVTPAVVVSAPAIKSKPKAVVATKATSSKPKSAVPVKAAASKTRTKTTDVAVKKQIRREKNREHAKKSRSKKRDYSIALEESVMALREENRKLRELVYRKFGETKAKTMVKERIRTPEDKMVESLKKQDNKVLSKSVIHYLQSLSCDVARKATR
ncbi:MAG: hypothetical protein SGBAC_004250 [Bacillariaceae sp.]